MNWARFLFIALPLALFSLAALAEGAAMVLSGVSLRRHDLDTIVVALNHAKLDAPIVIAGDSVTQDTLKTHQIAPPGKIANLTTNEASGLIGTALLLRRYLERNAPPRHLLVASTPEFYAYHPDGAAAQVYVTSVFQKTDEKAELARLNIGGHESWWPAVLMIQERVWDKLTSSVTPAVTELPVGGVKPEPTGLEAVLVPPRLAAELTKRAEMKLDLSLSARRALELICADSARYGFTLHLIRGPVPETVLVAWGSTENFNAQLRAATAGCGAVVIEDINSRQVFPDYAFRDPDHLRRAGWTALYGRLLAEYVGNLMDR